MTKSDPASPRPSKSPRKGKPNGSKRQLNKWVRRSAIAVGGGVVLVLVGVGIAGTGPVLRAITPMINETVSGATDSQFELGRVDGSIWTGLQLDHLSMSRAVDGFDLDLGNVVFDWSLSFFTRFVAMV